MEITPWKKAGCTLALEVSKLSNRPYFSREINEVDGEGGSLNANYTFVDAVAKTSAILGNAGLAYGEDFIFKTGDEGAIILDFKDEATRHLAELQFASDAVLRPTTA